MKWRNTLILIVVCAVLGGYVYFFEMKKEPETTTETTTALTIFDVADGDIIQLAVQSEEGRTRVTRSEDGESWQMEEPTQEEADKGRLDSLALRIASLKASRALTDTAEALADYGLASPQITATIKLKSEEETSLFIGDQTPNKSSYYLQKEGDQTVYIVVSSLGNDLKRLITEPPEKPTPTPTAMPVITVTATIMAPAETITATVEPTITASAEPTTTEVTVPTILPGVELPGTPTAEPTSTEVARPTTTSTPAPTDTATTRPTKTATAQP